MDRFHCLSLSPQQGQKCTTPKYGTGERDPPAGHQHKKNRKIFGKMKDILFLCIGFLYNMDMILVHVLFSKDFCQKSIEAVK